MPLNEVATALLILSQGWSTNLLDAPITFRIWSSAFSALVSELKLFDCIAAQISIASLLFP